MNGSQAYFGVPCGMPAEAGAIPADPAAPDHLWPNRWPRRDALELAAIPSAIPCARARMRAVLREWGMAGLVPDAEIVLAELATNALRAIQRLASQQNAEGASAIGAAQRKPEAGAEEGVVRLWMLGDFISADRVGRDGLAHAPAA